MTARVLRMGGQARRLGTLVLPSVVALVVAVSSHAARADIPGVPPSVTHGLQQWGSRAQAVVDHTSGFATLLQAVPRAMVACNQPLGRPYLAGGITSAAGAFLGFVHIAAQGEVSLYALSKQFKTALQKSRYVASLDRVGTVFDNLLQVGKNAQTVGSKISSGDCGTASGLASMTAGTLLLDIKKLDGALAQLQAAYGM